MKKIIILLFVLTICPPLTAAQITYEDLDNDGDPDLATVTEFGITAKIYDQNDDMEETGNWTTSTDFDSDIWIFSSGGEIAIDFEKEGSKLKALIYEDVNGDGIISIDELNFKITESKTPQIIARADDWNIGDVEFNVDGKIRTSHAAFNERLFIPQSKFNETLDYKISFHDKDRDGIFDIEYAEILMTSEQEREIYGGWDWIRWFAVDIYDEEGKTSDYFFWRFLNSIIKVNWAEGKIDQMYFPINYINEGKHWSNWAANNGWWENPFSFFDLAEDKDGIPELSVKLADEPLLGTYDSFRYSWDLDNDGDYGMDFDQGLSGSGRVRYNYLNEYPFGKVNHVPYDKVKDFIFSSEWHTIKFYEDESDVWSTFEGVWELHPWNREEQDINPTGAIKLYISGLDKKLHLLNAEEGIWRINLSDSVKYDSSNRAYVDRITHYKISVAEEENIDSTLAYYSELLIYSDLDGTIIKQKSIDPIIKEFDPPKTNEDRLNLKNALDKYTTSVNLKDLFDQFETNKKLIIKNGFIASALTIKEEFFVTLVCDTECELKFENFDRKMYLNNEEVAKDTTLPVGKYILSAFKIETPLIEIGYGELHKLILEKIKAELEAGAKKLAEKEAEIEISYDDLDNDGDPDLATLKKIVGVIVGQPTYLLEEEVTTASIAVTAKVYDADDDMSRTYDWTTSTDFDSDIWIFSSGGEIAIDFEKEGSKLKALIYEDVNGDGIISIDELNFKITEPSPPKIVAVAESWKRGDVTFYIDGTINLIGAWTPWTGTEFDVDGKPDFKIVYYDNDKDGDFDLEYHEFLNFDDAIGKTDKDLYIKFFVEDVDDSAEIRKYCFWRFLGCGYGESAIDVDWSSGEIEYIEQIINTFTDKIHTIEGNYWSNFLYDRFFDSFRWWENFFFYDAAEDGDGIPELVIGLWDDPPENGTYDIFEYSWDLDNDGIKQPDWDMSISGRGDPFNNSYSYSFDYKFETVNHIPYEKAKDFVLSGNWKSVKFNDVEGHENHASLEGVTENHHPYFPWVGERLDWNHHFSGQRIKLYLSNLDKKLHLANAEGGRWLLNENEVIEYDNSDRGYIDKMTHNQINFEKNGDEILWDTYSIVKTLGTLSYYPEYLVYSDLDGTIIKQKSIDPIIKEFDPPKTNEDRLNLKNALDKYTTSANLKDLFDQFESNKKLTIENGFISSALATKGEFFVALVCDTECELKFENFDRKMYLNNEEVAKDTTLPAGKYILSDRAPDQLRQLKKENITVTKIQASSLGKQQTVFVGFFIFVIIFFMIYYLYRNEIKL